MTDSLIKYNDLEKAANCVGSDILAAGMTPKKCKYCGKDYIKTELNVFNQKRIVYSVPCDCIEKEERKAAQEAAKSKLRERYQKANIGKRYVDITLDKLGEMGTEHVSDAQKYVSEFNPESGKSIHMIGDFGNGKTSVGYGITKELLKKGFNCVSTTWTEICSRCYYAKSFSSTETNEQILDGLSKFDFIMLDEFVINTKKEEETILATELLDRWYKDNKCFLIINNPCDIKDMKTVPRLGKLLDRVRHQAEKWIFEKESYRTAE